MSRYERYRLLTANHTTILEEAFNLEVPIRLPPIKPPSLGLNATTYYMYHRDRTTTKQEQDLEDTERSSRGITMQTEEEIERNIESSMSQKCHLHAIRDININFVDSPLERSLPPITFTDRDFKVINPINQDNLIVVSIVIANFMVPKVLIDQGNSIDILYWRTFQRLEVSPDTVHLHVSPLLGFAGKRVEATWT
ncbi:hypothetical protein JHK84_048100 [Glycine max]|nr:hypothetical protein JHK86_048066 [Glycine max]KAG4944043.1 hypothetical protein JHK85_048689 [Glycine max]KAG5103131.1 hypothetical protein JHK84_048100 [Glycine max]